MASFTPPEFVLPGRSIICNAPHRFESAFCNEILRDLSNVLPFAKKCDVHHPDANIQCLITEEYKLAISAPKLDKVQGGPDSWQNYWLNTEWDIISRRNTLRPRNPKVRLRVEDESAETPVDVDEVSLALAWTSRLIADVVVKVKVEVRETLKRRSLGTKETTQGSRKRRQVLRLDPSQAKERTVEFLIRSRPV